MCGIAGRVGPEAGSRAVIRAMTDTLIHRGPDEDGFFVAPGIELGMRRLSIIDIRDGQQPVTDESGNIVVVFNGEIYNFVELRNQLESHGHRFRSRSDSEVIAHLYEQEGSKFLTRLRGMFAIAIWDRRSRTLLLARDRIGKKPLLYRIEADGGLSFASEARALFRPLGITPTADLGALNRVLSFGHADSPYSAYSGLIRLAPGSLVQWRGGQVTTEAYWEPDFSAPENWTEQEAVERSLAAIDEAVRIRLVSERPIGAFLSGGIDSTAVLVSFLRNTTEEEKKNIVVFCSSSSMYENTNFYIKHILNKLYCKNSADLVVTNEFLNNHILVHGDPADAIFGPSMPMYKNFVKENIHTEDWKKHRDEMVKILNNEIDPTSRHELNRGYGDWIFDKVSNTIIESKNDDYVSSVADWWWWTYFNFKWEFSVCRPLYYYRVKDYNNPIAESNFNEYVKNTFFHTDRFQLWTYSNLKTLIGRNGMNHKSLIKQYIYDYNKDENYFLNKKKIGSAPPNSDLKNIHQSCPVYWDKEWKGHTFYEEGHLQKVVYLLLKKYQG